MTTKLTGDNVQFQNLSVSWQSVITADGSTNTNLVSGRGYFIDTTSAAHTVVLPTTPTRGDVIKIKDYADTFATNNLTISRNGHNIQGVAGDVTISTNKSSISLFYVDSTKGWLFNDESNVIELSGVGFISATGGTVTTSELYKIHTFTGDGCFVVSSLSPSSPYNVVDYMVVAGGGGGGQSNGSGGGGGGGAGGWRASSGTASGCYTAGPSCLVGCVSGITATVTTYPITVGAGGTGGTGPTASTSGSNSVFSTITSTGGGYGGNVDYPGPLWSGGPGGSGGGARSYSPLTITVGSGNTPPSSPPQGNNGGGGNCAPTAAPGYGAGGGGGATAVGGDNCGSVGCGGIGGTGTTSVITGTSTGYAGGGGGGSRRTGGSATQGGGNGGNNNTQGCAGTANTGGGGGGGGDDNGGNGGKGVVILRYRYI